MNRPMCALLALWASATAQGQSSAGWRMEIVAGSSSNGDGGPALQAEIGAIQGIAVDKSGNLYLSDTDHHRVRKVSVNGAISTVAGTGIAGFSGDSGPAASAQLNLPYGLAADGAGNLYIADLGNSRIRRVAPDGTISTYAGGGSSAGEGGLAATANLRTPRNVAVDAAGNLYLSEFEGHRVRKVTPDGRIATVAGTGVAGFRGDGGPAMSAQLAYPAGLAIDRAGSLYIADSQNQRIRWISPGGTIATVAGASPALGTVISVAVDASGVLYAADGSGLRRCSPRTCPVIPGTQAPGDLAMDSAGSLYLADGSQLRKMDVHGQITTIAGDAYQHAIGDGGPAASAQLLQPAALALDTAGNLYIADSGTERVRQVSAAGIVQTVAGTGTAGGGANDLHSPMGLTLDSAGEAVVADTGNHRIRKAAGGALSAVMGTGTAGMGPEGLAPSSTALNGPRGVCAAADGTLFVVDTGNHRVLRLPPGGMVETAAGNGSPGFAGDGGPARLAQLNQPSGCALDTGGNLFIADAVNNRIRKVSADGAISTVVAGLNTPRGVAADTAGSLWISDSGNDRVCRLSGDGVLTVIAGADELHAPGGVAIDPSGAVYVADSGNNRVLRFTPPSVSVVNAASLTAGAVSPGEIVTIFGSGIGPATGAAATFDANGMLPTQLGGSEAHFDGLAAPLFYAQSGQINAQVPYSVMGGSTQFEVYFQGIRISATDLAVAPAAPALFPSPVTQDNPAARGSVVTLFATGEGQTTGPNVSGQAAATPLPQPVLPVALTIAGVPAQLLYAGSAPGAAGVLQVNAIMPGGFVAAGPAVARLSVGSFVSPPITIWLK